VQGSQTGAGGGGQAAATGVGCLNQLQQQPQPALVSVNPTRASRIDILFISRVSLPEHPLNHPTASNGIQFDASSARGLNAMQFATQPYLRRDDVQTQPLKKDNVRSGNCADCDKWGSFSVATVFAGARRSRRQARVAL
jgi:hypothetical protein